MTLKYSLYLVRSVLQSVETESLLVTRRQDQKLPNLERGLGRGARECGGRCITQATSSTTLGRLTELICVKEGSLSTGSLDFLLGNHQLPHRHPRAAWSPT